MLLLLALPVAPSVPSLQSYQSTGYCYCLGLAANDYCDQPRTCMAPSIRGPPPSFTLDILPGAGRLHT